MAGIDIEARIVSAQQSHRIAPGSQNGAKSASPVGPSFADVLKEKVQPAASNGIKFSAHAQTRLRSRNITLSEQDLVNLGNAITKAASKGARESLVLTDKAALVVSVPNRTVITAVDKSSLKDNIFTNIDSAVII